MWINLLKKHLENSALFVQKCTLTGIWMQQNLRYKEVQDNNCLKCIWLSLQSYYPQGAHSFLFMLYFVQVFFSFLDFLFYSSFDSWTSSYPVPSFVFLSFLSFIPFSISLKVVICTSDVSSYKKNQWQWLSSVQALTIYSLLHLCIYF